jgi:hypothetical protein
MTEPLIEGADLPTHTFTSHEFTCLTHTNEIIISLSINPRLSLVVCLRWNGNMKSDTIINSLSDTKINSPPPSNVFQQLPRVTLFQQYVPTVISVPIVAAFFSYNYLGSHCCNRIFEK